MSHKITHKDLMKIISDATDIYNRQNFSKVLSQKEVTYGEWRNICVIKAFLMHLNQNNLLNDNVKFDLEVLVAEAEE